MSKTWYLTGSSRGFGRGWATAASERGDRVAATARDTDMLSDLVDRFGDAVLPPPKRLLRGSQAFDSVLQVYEPRMSAWREWETVSRSTDAS